MSTVSACPIKATVITPKAGAGGFNRHIGNSLSYSLGDIVDSSDDCPFKTDQFIDQHRRNPLPAPHLLLQSGTDHISSPSASSNISVDHTHSNGHYSSMLNYGNSSAAASLSNRDSSVNMKQTNFMNYPNCSRSNYNYTRTGVNSPQFDIIPEPITFNNTDPSNFHMLSTNGFSNWNTNSTHELKMDTRCEYRNHLVTEPQQQQQSQMIGQDKFPLLSPTGNRQIYSTLNRCPSSSCATPILEEHSNQAVHISSGNLTPLPMHQYESISYRGIEDRTYTNISTSSSNSLGIQSSSNMGMSCDNKQPTVVTTRMSRTSTGGTKESPVSYAVAMTPDSSTTGFTANKLGCSSDDGETSPTPTCSSECPPGQSRKPAPTLATGRRNLKGEMVDPDEADRRMKRRERNRKSAQKCRERKVQRTHELQSQVECLQLEASRLMQELDGWRTRARQCVALLQHHCPGVTLPYLSCLNESPPSLSGFKEPIDSLTEVTSFDKTTNYESPQMVWKSKQSRKQFSTNNTPNTNNFTSNESTTVLPPVNQLHSHITPNRSKSLFGFSLNNTDHNNDSRNYSSISESVNLSPANQDCNISGSQLLPMTRSTSVASMLQGLASGPSSSSSSSSCSTYELSFSVENHPPAVGNFKQYPESNSLMTVDSRSRSRVPSGQIMSDNSTINMLTKPITMMSNESNHKQTNKWDLESDDKNSMDCTVLSPINSTLKKGDHTILMDGKSTVDSDSEMINHKQSLNKLEGACYS